MAAIKGKRTSADFTPEWRRKISESAKRRYAEGKMAQLHRGPPSDQSASNNPSWKGGDAGYDAIHRWIRRHFTKTGTCERCGATPEPITYMRKGKPVTRVMTAWANVSGEYRREDRSDWLEVCWPCHAVIDNRVRNLQ